MLKEDVWGVGSTFPKKEEHLRFQMTRSPSYHGVPVPQLASGFGFEIKVPSYGHDSHWLCDPPSLLSDGHGRLFTRK